MSNIPKDPVMLLSFVNLKLRDYYSSLDELCAAEGIDKEDLVLKLTAIDYSYDEAANRFN